MNTQVKLSEVDIVDVLARHYYVDKSQVSLRHFKETIGYGYSAAEVDRVEVTVNIPELFIDGKPFDELMKGVRGET